MNQEQPLRPANIANIVGINQGKRPLTMETPVAEALSPAAANELIKNGCLVIDSREESAFGAGHIPGAYNMQLSSSEFEQRVGWVTPIDEPIILVANTAEEAQRGIYLLAFLGLDQRVKGFVEGGMEAWASAGLPVKKLEQMSVQTLYQKLQSNGHQVLDVRETSEWDDGHVQNAHYINFKVIRNRIGELTLSPDDHIAVVCGTGKRSSTASSILLMNDYQHVYNVIGGMTAWRDAAYPMIDAQGVVCNV